MGDGLLIPCEAGPSPRQHIEVDGYEGDVHVDIRAVSDDGTLALTPREALMLAYALRFFAEEQEGVGQ